MNSPRRELAWTATFVVLAACSAQPTASSPVATSSPDASPSAAPSKSGPEATTLTVTLNDDGCELTGPRQLESGPVVVEVHNQDAADRASVQLLQVGAGGTFDDLVEHLAEEQARIDAGEDPAGAPAYASEVVGTLLDPGTQDELEATLENGIYSVVCADWADAGGVSGGTHPEQGGRIIASGQLTVGD